MTKGTVNLPTDACAECYKFNQLYLGFQSKVTATHKVLEQLTFTSREIEEELFNVYSKMKWKHWFEVSLAEVITSEELFKDYVEVPSTPPFTALIDNLDPETTEKSVREFFNDPKVKSTHLTKEGYGYVEFSSRDMLIEGLNKDGDMFNGKKIMVSIGKRILEEDVKQDVYESHSSREWGGARPKTGESLSTGRCDSRNGNRNHKRGHNDRGGVSDRDGYGEREQAVSDGGCERDCRTTYYNTDRDEEQRYNDNRGNNCRGRGRSYADMGGNRYIYSKRNDRGLTSRDKGSDRGYGDRYGRGGKFDDRKGGQKYSGKDNREYCNRTGSGDGDWHSGGGSAERSRCGQNSRGRAYRGKKSCDRKNDNRSEVQNWRRSEADTGGDSENSCEHEVSSYANSNFQKETHAFCRARPPRRSRGRSLNNVNDLTESHYGRSLEDVRIDDYSSHDMRSSWYGRSLEDIRCRGYTSSARTPFQRRGRNKRRW